MNNVLQTLCIRVLIMFMLLTRFLRRISIGSNGFRLHAQHNANLTGKKCDFLMPLSDINLYHVRIPSQETC